MESHSRAFLVAFNPFPPNGCNTLLSSHLPWPSAAPSRTGYLLYQISLTLDWREMLRACLIGQQDDIFSFGTRLHQKQTLLKEIKPTVCVGWVCICMCLPWSPYQNQQTNIKSQFSSSMVHS